MEEGVVEVGAAEEGGGEDDVDVDAAVEEEGGAVVLDAVAPARRLETTMSALEKSESTDDWSAALDELAAAARLVMTDAASLNCELTNDSSAEKRDAEACAGLSGVVMGAAIRGVLAGRVVRWISLVRVAVAAADLLDDAEAAAAAAARLLELAAAARLDLELALATARLVLAAALLLLLLALALASACAARMTTLRRLEQMATTCAVDALPLYAAATAPQSVEAVTSSSASSNAAYAVRGPDGDAWRATRACRRNDESVA